MTIPPKEKAEPEPSDAQDTWADDQASREYYYDDAHGYETYKADDDEDSAGEKEAAD